MNEVEEKKDDVLEINSSNFTEYFKVCGRNKPCKGEIIAKFTAIAEFIDGRMKQDIIDLLYNKEGKVQAAIQVLIKLGGAIEKDAIKVCKNICSDLYSGMTPEEVEAKVYKYQMESFYYTKKEYVPIDDPHWEIINIKNLDDFLDSSGATLRMESKLTVDSKKEENEEEEEKEAEEEKSEKTEEVQ